MFSNSLFNQLWDSLNTLPTTPRTTLNESNTKESTVTTCTTTECQPTATKADTRKRVSTRRPRADVLSDDNAYYVILEIPGAAKDSVTIDLEDDLLKISAEAPAVDIADASWLRHERGSLRYERHFEIGSEVDSDGISASVDNGVLSLRLPKARRARRIEIA